MSLIGGQRDNTPIDLATVPPPHQAKSVGTASRTEELIHATVSARIFPEFLHSVLADYKILGGKFHIAGPSNGGIAAFHVAAANPQYFLSVTAFPGYMWQPTTAKLQAISKLCVFMYVGESDEYKWHDEMKREAEFLNAAGRSHATPSKVGNLTAWRRSPEPTQDVYSTDSRKLPRDVGASIATQRCAAA